MVLKNVLMIIRGTMKWVDKLNWNGQNANNFKNLDLNPWLDSNKNVVGNIYRLLYKILKNLIII